MNIKKKIAQKLREVSHRLDPQPYVEQNDKGWTIRTKGGMGLATISPGASVI